MNRRDFVKLLGLTALAITLPVDILVDNRDDETKMFEELLNSVDDELVVISFLKEHLFAINKGERLMQHYVQSPVDGVLRIDISKRNIVKEFTDRQPNLINWLKSKVYPHKHDENSRFSMSKRFFNYEDTKWIGYSLYHKKYAPKYSQPIVKHFDSREEWFKEHLV